MSRPDLPCPWCKGRVRHVVGCPAPPSRGELRVVPSPAVPRGTVLVHPDDYQVFKRGLEGET